MSCHYRNTCVNNQSSSTHCSTVFSKVRITELENGGMTDRTITICPRSSSDLGGIKNHTTLNSWTYIFQQALTGLNVCFVPLLHIIFSFELFCFFWITCRFIYIFFWLLQWMKYKWVVYMYTIYGILAMRK